MGIYTPLPPGWGVPFENLDSGNNLPVQLLPKEANYGLTHFWLIENNLLVQFLPSPEYPSLHVQV